MARKKDGLGDRLAALGFINDADVPAFLSQQYRIPTVDLDAYEIAAAVLDLVPRALCLEHSVLPVAQPARSLVVAMSDPANVTALEALREATGLTVEPVLAAEAAIARAIEKYYGPEQ